MTYRTFAWPIHESNKVLKSKGEALRIISGEVDFASYAQKFTIDKIIKASLLHRDQDNKGIIMKLVIQLADKIVVFSLNHKKKIFTFCEARD